jgi:hypothetical protein
MSSLWAAVKLMEQYGVVLDAADVQKMEGMNESQQINSLVGKMPQQSNEQFQHFFLQLQILVSTASRIRKALEEGNAAEVDQALSEAEATGISQYLSRMAIVQAGTEVRTLKTQYQAWMKDANIRMGALIRGQEDAMQAQKKLTKAQDELTAFLTSQNEKVKKVLVNFLGGNSAAMQATYFKEWNKLVKDIKMEKEIRAEFQVRMDNVQQKLMEYKVSQSAGISKMMQRRAEGKVEELILEVFDAWKQDYKDEKLIRDNAAEAAEIEARLAEMKKAQSANSKKVLARLTGKNEMALVEETFMAWKEDLLTRKLADLQAAQEKEAEERLIRILAEKKEGTKKALGSLAAGTDQALYKLTYDAWKECWDDMKREAAVAEALAQAGEKMSAFNGRNKMGAMSVSEKAAFLQDQYILMRTMYSWKLDVKMEKALKKQEAAITSKRQQLVMVQQMFKDFASKLETGLKEDNSGRMSEGGSKKMGSKSGSVSLPDIHQR